MTVSPTPNHSIEGSLIDKKKVVFLLCIKSFLISISYGLIRTTIETDYNLLYKASKLPDVWLYTALPLIVLVFIYNHFVSRHNLLSVFRWSVVLSFLPLPILFLLRKFGLKQATLLLFMWKDIYILVLVECFWSFTQIITRFFAAKKVYWLYGFFGALGALIGYITAYAASKNFISSDWLFYFELPVFIGILSCSFLLVKIVKLPIPEYKQGVFRMFIEIKDSLKMLLTNTYLMGILTIVLLSQLVLSLIDWQIYHFFDEHQTLKVLQLGVRSMNLIVVNGFGLLFDLLTGLMLIRFLGITGPLLVVPVLLGSVIFFGGIIFPQDSLFWVRGLYILSKSLDFSLFTIGKELLFSPLNYKEKTRSKALIGMMVYRLGKVLSAYVVKFCEWLVRYFKYFSVDKTIYVVKFFMIGVWFVVAIWLIRQYHEKSSQIKEET